MPHVINGIGTWYYGKRNIHRLRGQCDHCRHLATISSYDTKLYFVIFFIPILPLRSKRVLGECSRCHMHLVMPLWRWNQAREADSAAFLEQLASKPGDRDTMRDGLLLALKFQDGGLFDRLATTLAGETQPDAELQDLLGDGYAYFGRDAEAVEAYRRALALKDEPATRERLMLALLRLGRTEEAQAAVAPALDQLTPENAWLAYCLAEGWQAQGDHEAALRLINDSQAKLPALVDDPEFKAKKALATKHLGTRKIIPSELLSAGGRGYETGNWTAHVPKLIAATIFLVALGLYLSSAWHLGQHRSAFFINGLNQPYTIRVQGQEVTLTPAEPRAITLPEGVWTIEPTGAKAHLKPFTVEVTTNYFSRPFTSPIFIINPDEVALLERAEAIYSANPPPMPPPTVVVGQHLLRFDDIDYLFADFPLQLKVEGNQTVRKSRLGVIKLPTAEQRIEFILIDMPADQRGPYLRRLVDAEPQQVAYLSALGALLPAAELQALVQSRLGDRPLLVEWHRLHQNLAEREHPPRDLRPEYDRLVQEMQRHPDALYLRGRLDDDPGSREMIRQAATATPPSTLAQYSLGYEHLAKGEYQEALAWLDRALAGSPENLQFKRARQEALYGLGQYSTLLAEQAKGGNPQNPPALLRRLSLLAMSGKQAQALAEVEQILAGVPPTVQPEEKKKIEATMKALIATASRDEAGFLEATKDYPDLQGPAYLLLKGQVREVGDLMKADAGATYDLNERACVYLFAEQAGQSELAKTQFTQLLQALRASDRRSRALAEMLDGKTPFDADWVLRLGVERSLKRTLLRVAAARHPDAAGRLLELSRRLDVDRDSTSLLLARLDRLAARR